MARSLPELAEDFQIARVDSIATNRRKAVRSILNELENLRPRDFASLELTVGVWKQVFRDTRTRKEHFIALDKTHATIEALVASASTDRETNWSFELLAEFAVDFSQRSASSVELNIIVSRLNRAIKYLGSHIGIGEVSEEESKGVSHMLCMRAQCRRALASLYKRRGNRGTGTRKRINSLRVDALNDAKRGFKLFHNQVSELEYALCLFANTDTTTSDYAQAGLSLLESAKKSGFNLLACYELIKQLRMRYQHEAAARLFVEVTNVDKDVMRNYENVTHLAAAVIGMHYDGTELGKLRQYALRASEWLEELISSERYKAKEIVDLCYIKAICGDSIDSAIKPLHLFKADSEAAWNDLASMAYHASKNEANLGDALLIGLEDPVIWSRIGSFYYEFVEDYRNAIAFYDRALSIDRHSPTFHLSKAQVFAYGLKDFEKARRSLDYVHSLKMRKYGWYKSKQREGVFAKLESYISSNAG